MEQSLNEVHQSIIMCNKLIFLLHLLLFSGMVGAQQKTFTLSGTIKNKTGVYIYLNYIEDDGVRETPKKDSSLISNGQFLFTGFLIGPAHASVSMDRRGGTSEKIVELFLVPGSLQLSLDYHNFREGAVMKGSPVQAEADALEKSKEIIITQMILLGETYRKANAVYREAVKAKKQETILECLKEASDLVKESMAPLQRQLNKMDLAFMDQYPTSFVTAYRLRWLLMKMSLEEAEDRYGKLPKKIRYSSLGKTIKQELDKMAKGAPGARAFQFASIELRGTPLNLEDYKGRYVLLDFWASWCIPCRKGNPHLLSLYTKYKNKGLEIIGISDDDRNPEAWKKAIDKDGIAVWKHVLRGMKRKADGSTDKSSSISDKYGIFTLPTKILIDPQGIIIGRYGEDGQSDEALDKKLAGLLDK